MIPLPSGIKIWLVAGITDMRNGFNGLAAKVQTALKDDPMSGHVFIFRGRSGSQVKLLWSTSDGLCLLTKRLERGRFAWPSARDGKVFLTQAQLAMLRSYSTKSGLGGGPDVCCHTGGMVVPRWHQRCLYVRNCRLRHGRAHDKRADR
ncbi:IS66 family element, orf2 [Shigella sonnei]|nr:IS66 family element, orf2 [Shigella sonnei]